MPQQHTEALRACAPAMTTPPTIITSARDSTAVENTKMHNNLPLTATICCKALLLLLLTLGCLLSTVTCVPAPATALAADPSPALRASPPTSSLNAVVDDQAVIASKRHFKRSPVMTTQEIADKNGAAMANSDIDDDYYDEEEPDDAEAGNGNENMSGRQRRHQQIAPTARFGYDGTKIKPQQFYTQQIVANALEVNNNIGTNLARTDNEQSPMAARLNNDLSVWSLMDNVRRMDICDVCSCDSKTYVDITCDYNQRNSRVSKKFIFNFI